MRTPNFQRTNLKNIVYYNSESLVFSYDCTDVDLKYTKLALTVTSGCPVLICIVGFFRNLDVG